MILVIDTNRIIAALIKDSTSRYIILSDKIEFVSIHFGTNEVNKYKNEIIEKAGITEADFENILQKLFTRIKMLNDSLVQKTMPEAKNIMDHIDPDDTPFIAAALACNVEIWSDDEHFQQQKRIKAWKTKDIINYLNMKNTGYE